MLRHMLNRCHTENLILKRQLQNNRFISFVSWIGLAFTVGIEKSSLMPVLFFFALVYAFVYFKGKL